MNNIYIIGTLDIYILKSLKKVYFCLGSDDGRIGIVGLKREANMLPLDFSFWSCELGFLLRSGTPNWEEVGPWSIIFLRLFIAVIL